ncbi:uncharacterized protein LOC117109031 [Anneissia japonica]|uniref:uncharacterized protein LOC117109031 n=1 Tax=Anneissia japonica TaxID=1529436 RepID=UPI00142556EC|nr:uncharacterized protein LOC117109031 [Anneissia japonica]
MFCLSDVQHVVIPFNTSLHTRTTRMRNTRAIKYSAWFITALSLSLLFSTKWELMLTTHKPPRPRVYRPADQTSIPQTEKLESPIENITKVGSDKMTIPTLASIKEARLKSSNRQMPKVSKPKETMGLINTSETTIILKNTGLIKVGDTFSVIIETRDSNDRHRLKGGDFWMANIRSRQANAAGKVIDFKNGTYEVVFFAAWAGNVSIEIILVHPSETTDFIENSVWPMKDRALWKGSFVSGNTSNGRTACRFRIKGEEDLQDKCEWSHPLAIGKTVFVCDKPKTLGCDTLFHLKSSSHHAFPNFDLLNNYTGIFSRFDNHYGSTLLKLMRVGNSNYTKHVTPKHTTHHSDILAFDFYFHPYSMGSLGYHYRVGKWEYEVLDNLNFSACNYVVMVSPWAHYSQWVKESTWERMRLLRETLIRFMKRCPKAQVMVKTPRPRYHQKGGDNIYTGEKMLHDIFELYHELFSDLGIHILDIWDMNVSHPAPNVIHMPMPIIYQ